MSNPLISVYITNYNYERFIEQSIESILNQTFSDWELIIIDDGSTDGSKEIIERYRDRPEVTIIYQQNKGLNITNNVAMRVAKGKYLMRLDADDYMVPEALEKIVAPLEADDALGLVFPDYYYVDAEGQITGEEKRHNFESEVSLYDQPAHGACTMIRLSFLKKLGGYNESFTCQDGYDLWLKFITHYTVRNVTEPLFYYRRHGANLTTNEERILSTRRAIKRTFLDQENMDHGSILVIPARNTKLKGTSLPLAEIEGNSLLNRRVEAGLESKVVSTVYIISEDEEVLSYARGKYQHETSVVVLERPAALAGPNQTLSGTVQLAVDHATQSGLKFHYIMTNALDYPFVGGEILDDAVHTIALFQCDSVLGVRPDNKMYYRHTGHSLVPILDQDKFTRLEREALYRAVGGVMATTVESFEKHGKVNGGTMGHVVIDERSAFGIFSEFDLQLYSLLVTAETQAEVE